MSGSPNIGLLGSIDATKELQKDGKDDSDLETYDTEALSIMDINDIIGVQSEPVSDSTLESEIAALSRMITESKSDGSQNATEEKLETQDEASKGKDASRVEDADDVHMSENALEDLEGMCEMERIMCVSDTDELNKESQVIDKNSEQEKVEINDQQEDNDNYETDITDSAPIVNTENVEKVDATDKVDVELVKPIVNSISTTSEVVRNMKDVNTPTVNQQEDPKDEIVTISRKIKTKENDNNICGSLQLIGEAYSSEDSQESNTDDTELKVTATVAEPNETVPCEARKETIESHELQHVNNFTRMSHDIDSDKTCTNRDVSAATAETETHSIEVASNCSTEHKYVDEFSNNLKDKEDIVPNECTVDNSKNIVAECKNEEVDKDIAATDMKEELLQEETIDNEVMQKNEIVEHCNTKMKVENIESMDETCTLLNEKQEIITKDDTETEKQQESAEYLDVEKERSPESEHVREEKEINQEDKEHVNSLDTENRTGDNNNTNIEKENESETELPQSHSESIDDASEIKKSDSPCTAHNSKVSENEADALELPQEKQETDAEGLKSTEEMQQNLLQSDVSESLTAETEQELPTNSQEDLMSVSHERTEDAEADRDVQTEDSKSQDLVISETEIMDHSVDESISTMELSVDEEKSENELKTCSSEASIKCEQSSEIELNLDSTAGISHPQAVSDITMLMETAEDNSTKKDSSEERNDEVGHEEELINTESLQDNERIEEQSKESHKVMDTVVKEIKSEEASNIPNMSQECTDSKDSEASAKHVDVHLDLPEENQAETEEEDSSSKICSEQECIIEKETSDLEEHEDTWKADEEEGLKQFLKDDETVIDAKVDEAKDFSKSDDQISDHTTDKRDLTSPALDYATPKISEEISEEDTEEEMSLILEPEEAELVPEVEEDNVHQDLENENVTETVEIHSKENEKDCAEAMNDADADSLSVEQTGVPETNAENITAVDSIENSIVDETEELSSREQIDENSLKDDVDKNNLKNILETASNVEEIFSEEQCQSSVDIVTNILDDVRSTSDFETDVVNEMEEVLQQSANLSPVGAEIEELTEKLPQNADILSKNMEDTISTPNIDSLEGLLGLDLIPEVEDSAVKMVKPEEEIQEQEALSKDVDMNLLLQQSNGSDITQAPDYMTDSISSCLTDRNAMLLEDSVEDNDATEIVDDKVEEVEENNILKVNEDVICESVNKNDDVEDLQKQLEISPDLQENELHMDFEGTPLEAVDDLEETEPKLELASDILLQAVDQSDNLNDTPTAIETSQPSSEISELESAVKFLQESEEQAIDSPLVLSPKMVENVSDISKQADTSSLFVPDEDLCEDASELVVELQDIAADSIAISEAEIISEAAKLESEKKLAEQVKLNASADKFEETEDKVAINEENIKVCETEDKFGPDSPQNVDVQQASNFESDKVSETIVTLSQNLLKASESIPKVSILEERLKEPPKIEIPTADITKVSVSPTTSKDSLLIQKDAKLIAYQKMLESPKLAEKSEPRIVETPRKDSEKHDFENVGSPRIILKIAKSAIADCGEPRSPKSPKIRSATNSPNPEDSPGQKLGKIKLKLSKGGHPSIISNENIEEMGQWYSEGSSSLSPIGMKIKLSKSGDASIVSSEKHEFVDDSKEMKHKFEEMKRTESPIGMKIKLSKSGDASIVQQDSKDVQMKHKDKLDIVQGSPKRTESPIGMKIKLSKSGDASIIQAERQDLSEEHRDSVQLRPKEKLDATYDSPKRTDSPIGMKIKLSKSGDASIVSPDMPEDGKEVSKMKDKVDSSPEVPRRTESPVGMKIKLAKTKGGASIISMENPEDAKEKLEIPEIPKRTESPFGMKIKLSKSGDASIVHSEISEEVKDMKQKERLEGKEKSEVAQEIIKSSDATSGMKIKVIKTGETSMVAQESVEKLEASQESSQKVESSIGMKIKLSKFGDASIVPTEKQEQPEEVKSLQELPKRTESPLGMKIKLSKTGDASIIQTEASEDISKMARATDVEPKAIDAALGMKIKLLKTGDASIVESEKKERHQRRRDTESPLEMKIKLSKTGHPTIIACENHGELSYRPKEVSDQSHNFSQRYKDSAQTGLKEPALKILKTGHSTILQSNRSELTIEPIQMQNKKADNVIEISPKRKDITIGPIEAKKSKLETQIAQILPEVTIQPVTSRDQKQFVFDPKNSAISLQQMNVISQEISITQVRPSKPQDSVMNEKLKEMLTKNTTGSPINSDCEIIEHRPELIIVNENSNSSQDVMIIEEVSPNRMPEVKVPKRRGRPRRNPLPQATIVPSHLLISRDQMPMEEMQQMQQPQPPHFEARENERPKRTCRSQKSYAPPKRGRGRGRGKRKLENVDLQMMKKPRVEQDLNAIEASTTAVITIDESPMQQQESFGKSLGLYKAIKQPMMEPKVSPTKVERKTMAQKNDGSKTMGVPNSASLDSINAQSVAIKAAEVGLELSKTMPKPVSYDSKDKKSMEVISEKVQKVASKSMPDEKSDKIAENAKLENRETLVPPGHSNWLTPMSKRPGEGAAKQENVSTVQVIDEETRMSAESNSRSQTPARNISAPASETIVNEESQGSVLSTATTESEKVKVKNRRMEINFDPDEGPFTVDKIAEYEWPLDRKGETFMIQEQISQYLGVKSFKRKYPDLKRRVVDMEERNYLRENGLVSEAMCDMGLTAICSSEVLDVMCSDFPDQYEEYRKHMREKQVKEHSKKQKELTAAANAEKNRIDLAEMAVQSALAWNISLNKDRTENRKCSLDLQTFTIHVPKKQQKVETERKIGNFPVALMPGQYTDYYREYTPAELRYYPLNTVLYGPMRPNERKFDSQSEGSQSDSDSDSSSDDSSSSSSEGTQDTEGSQSTMDDVDMEIVNQKDEVKLKCKMCLKALNKHSKNEVLIQCGTCNGHVHPSCIDLTLDMVPHIQSYAWQCTDCKTCAQCHDPADEDKMLFCDMCDRGYHIYCVGLRRVPQGRWHCQECAVCANCSSREPGGMNSDRNSVAQWQHEYKKGDKNTRVYVSTLCVPCSKLWRKGRYCPHCSRCHTAPRLDLEANLVHCSACDKYLHLGCVETKGIMLDRKNYLCDFCAPNRQHVVKPLISKTLRT